MRHVHLIDTAIASDNAGDEIIMAEVRRQILPLVGHSHAAAASVRGDRPFHHAVPAGGSLMPRPSIGD